MFNRVICLRQHDRPTAVPEARPSNNAKLIAAQPAPVCFHVRQVNAVNKQNMHSHSVCNHTSPPQRLSCTLYRHDTAGALMHSL